MRSREDVACTSAGTPIWLPLVKTGITGEMVRFGIVGVLNVLVSFVAYYLTYNVWQAPGGFVDLAMWLFRLAGVTMPTDGVGFVNGAFANVVAYGVGMMNSFILNKTWTFKIREDTVGQMFRFMVINCAALALSTVAIFLLVDVGGWPYVITWFAVIAPVTVLSFAANKFWAFSATRH